MSNNIQGLALIGGQPVRGKGAVFQAFDPSKNEALGPDFNAVDAAQVLDDALVGLLGHRPGPRFRRREPAVHGRPVLHGPHRRDTDGADRLVDAHYRIDHERPSIITGAPKSWKAIRRST